jgi:hypothetical protein
MGKITENSYPKNHDRSTELFGYGGVQVFYCKSQSQAEEIAEQFDLFLPPARESGEYFYVNVNHGERHELLFTSAECVIEHAIAIVPQQYQKYLHDEHLPRWAKIQATQEHPKIEGLKSPRIERFLKIKK